MPIPPPDSQSQALLDELNRLADQYSYSPLLINVPSTEETEILFKELCLRTLNEPAKYDRYWITDAIKGKAGLVSAFLGFVYTSAEKLRETKDTEWLEVGAGAVILQSDYPDWRDSILAVAELYVTAEECGLDPDVAFKKTGYGDDGYLKNLPVVCERRRYKR